MRKIERRAIAATCTLVLACGGAEPKPQNTTTLPIASATASAVPKVDLSPVPMPESLVVLVHVAHPAASADVISAWAGQPLDAQSALAEMVGERVAKVVDLDAPADLAVSVKDRGGRREPDASFAVSLPVKNFEAAKATLQGDYGLLPIDNGAFEIQRSGGGRRDGDSDFRVCALAPAIGGARVVCSRDATARDALLPFLTRGTSGLASIKSDVHVEARPGPFHELADRERADIARSGAHFMGGSAMRPAWQAGIFDLVDSFTDVTKATLDADIDQTHGTARMTIHANGSKGLVTRILSAHPERAEAPPANFFKLPSDADFAFFEHGLDADQLAPPKEALLHSLEAAMSDDDKLKAADRTALLDAIGRTFDLFALPVVYARGVDFAKAVPAVNGLTDASDVAKIRAGVEQAAGWDVFGVEAPPEKITAVLKGWSAALARPGVVASMHHDAPTFRVSGAPRGAPPGTIAFSLGIKHERWDYNGPKPKQKPPLVLAMHTLVVPDHGTVWVVNALDEATAVAKARALVSGAGGTLSGRAGLEALKNGHVNAAGFVTPRGLGLGIPMGWLVGSPWYKVTNDPLMGISSSSQYTTPLLITAAEGASGSERSLTLSADVPRAALADFLAIGPRIFH
ncbi:MAG TPA: hypothetical protein VGH28_31040 [Polyangiaceae bacterium]|jgi:hypothetical protein